MVRYLMPNPLKTYILDIYGLVWFGLVWLYGISTSANYLLWYINYCRLFNTESYLFTYIKYIWFGFVLWHINPCRLFNVKFCLHIYTKYIWFCFVWFYGISTLVGYLMSNSVYTYILNIYDLLTYFVDNIFKPA